MLLFEEGGFVKIGRAFDYSTVALPGNGRFSSPFLSRNHAILSFTNGQIWLQDLGSRYGTYINGTLISPRKAESEQIMLSNGEVLVFGANDEDEIDEDVVSCEFTVRFQQESAPPSPSKTYLNSKSDRRSVQFKSNSQSFDMQVARPTALQESQVPTLSVHTLSSEIYPQEVIAEHAHSMPVSPSAHEQPATNIVHGETQSVPGVSPASTGGISPSQADFDLQRPSLVSVTSQSPLAPPQLPPPLPQPLYDIPQPPIAPPPPPAPPLPPPPPPVSLADVSQHPPAPPLPPAPPKAPSFAPPAPPVPPGAHSGKSSTSKVSIAETAASGGNDRGNFLLEIQNAKLRKQNRKVTVQEPTTPSPVKEALVKSKSDLIMELLGYMEAPGGNVSEYAEKCLAATNTARNYIDTFIRRGWLLALRVEVKRDASICPEPEVCAIWPGKEWTRAINLKDVTRAELHKHFPKEQILHTFRLYRFDINFKEHVLDELALVKTFRFPKIVVPYNEPEPVPETFRNLLQWRLAQEQWHTKKSKHTQSDYVQYQLLTGKLDMCDLQIKGAFRLLTTTIANVSKLITSIVNMFQPIPIEDLQKLVDSIPSQIKAIIANLEAESGIIIKDQESIKLAPKFVQNLIKGPVNVPRRESVAPLDIRNLKDRFLSAEDTGRKRASKNDKPNARPSTWFGV